MRRGRRGWLSSLRYIANGALAALVLLAAPFAARADVVDAYPGVAAAYLVTVDGTPTWGAHVDDALPPASLTKMMAALVVAEGIRVRGDADVVVSKRAAGAGGARLGLRAGESFTASDLVSAMMVASANDACLAAVEWHSGSERAFVRAMNARAQSMGLHATRFVDACGFDADDHRASARDIATLSRASMGEPLIAAAAGTAELRIASRAGRALRHPSTNALLGRVPGVVGVKTGYTRKAGRCLSVVALRDGHRVEVVLLGAGDRWWDAVAMIEHAFDLARARPRAAPPAKPVKR